MIVVSLIIQVATCPVAALSNTMLACPVTPRSAIPATAQSPPGEPSEPPPTRLAPLRSHVASAPALLNNRSALPSPLRSPIAATVQPAPGPPTLLVPTIWFCAPNDIQ